MRNTLSTIYKICKDDITEIENFYEAILDRSEVYECHHRLETHDEFGNLRNKLVSGAELISQGLYYNRPASELIFIKKSEHSRLHRQFSNIDGHRYLSEDDKENEVAEIQAEYIRKYRLDKDKYNKQLEANKKYQEKNKEKVREYTKDYSNQLCLYNEETLRLGTLGQRFRDQGISHPFREAKKYLINK